MQNIYSYLDAIVSTYRDIPELVQILAGDSEAIFSDKTIRPDSPSYLDTLNKMPIPGLMVSHINTVLGTRGGNLTHWRHSFRLDLKVPGDVLGSYADAIILLVDGIPASGDGQPVINCSFSDYTDNMEDMVITKESAADGKDYYRMEFALQERVA